MKSPDKTLTVSLCITHTLAMGGAKMQPVYRVNEYCGDVASLGWLRRFSKIWRPARPVYPLTRQEPVKTMNYENSKQFTGDLH